MVSKDDTVWKGPTDWDDEHGSGGTVTGNIQYIYMFGIFKLTQVVLSCCWPWLTHMPPKPSRDAMRNVKLRCEM
jgi:hypothetical protein